MVEAQNTQTPSNPNFEAVKAASARVEQKAREMYDVVVDASLKWAGFSLGFGKNALAQSARALDRAAEALANLEGKLKKAEPEATAEATEEKPADPTAN